MQLSRTAPNGDTVVMTVPAALGEHQWFGVTRFAGPRLARQLTLAPAGQHRLVPTKILSAATTSSWQFRGHDVLLYEERDRSQACLAWVGPHHEASTWFGGPAPQGGALHTMLRTVTFRDTALGATVRPAVPAVRQLGVTLIGSGSDSLLMIRPATQGAGSLPDWAGMRLAAGELWRTDRSLSASEAGRVAGTTLQWRYILATDTSIVDVVLRGPVSRSTRPSMSADELIRAFDGLRVRWGG